MMVAGGSALDWMVKEGVLEGVPSKTEEPDLHRKKGSLSRKLAGHTAMGIGKEVYMGSLGVWEHKAKTKTGWKGWQSSILKGLV